MSSEEMTWSFLGYLEWVGCKQWAYFDVVNAIVQAF
jgi:hypothetical protein